MIFNACYKCDISFFESGVIISVYTICTGCLKQQQQQQTKNKTKTEKKNGVVNQQNSKNGPI